MQAQGRGWRVGGRAAPLVRRVCWWREAGGGEQEDRAGQQGLVQACGECLGARAWAASRALVHEAAMAVTETAPCPIDMTA
jgi:hypothetical protein